MKKLGIPSQRGIPKLGFLDLIKSTPIPSIELYPPPPPIPSITSIWNSRLSATNSQSLEFEELRKYIIPGGATRRKFQGNIKYSHTNNIFF